MAKKRRIANGEWRIAARSQGGNASGESRMANRASIQGWSASRESQIANGESRLEPRLGRMPPIARRSSAERTICDSRFAICDSAIRD
jgi:hypothetical protein